MKKKDGPLIIIIVSFILIIANIFTTDSNSLGFWLRISSSVLLIIAMYLTIRERAKGTSNKN